MDGETRKKIKLQKLLQIICDNEYSVYIFTGIICFIMFVAIYGVRILNPMYTDWLMNGEDLTQHYLGWKAYRESGWHFPIGMTDTLAYPNLTTVIFTDSIPLLAVFFKIFAPLLPASFQYFGIWGALCFILQGIMAVRILRNYSSNNFALVLMGALFAVTPAMLWRMFVHTALAGQWILLYAMEPLFAYDRYKDNNKLYRNVAIMAILAAGTHIYFILMCGIILIGIMLLDGIKGKRWKRVGLVLLEYLFCAAGMVMLLGGFSTKMTMTEGDLGEYSFNLNSFFDPNGWSCLSSGISGYTRGQYEGFSYFGKGYSLICLVIVIGVLLKIKHKEKLNVKWNVMYSVLVVVCVLSICVAASPIVTCGDKVLFTMVLPDFIYNTWSVFRSSGRIVWVAMYIIMLCLCICVCKLQKKQSTLVILFAFVVGLQIFDIHDVLVEKHDILANKVEYQSQLGEKDFWNNLARNKEIRHVLYYSEMSNAFMFSVTDWALESGKTVNDFYFAKQGYKFEIEQNRREILADLPSDYVVIFASEDEKQCQDMNLYTYSVDGVIVGSRKDLNYKN